MELGLSLGEPAAVPDAGRAAPELGLGLAVGPAGRGEDAGRGSKAATGAARWWAGPVAEPEPAVRLSLLSSLGLQWPPTTSHSGGRSSEALARGFDVNRAPSAAAATSLLGMEDDEEDPASSSPNDSAGSFPLDLGRRAHADGAAAAQDRPGGERSSSRASDEDEGASARKKLRLTKEQAAFLDESFKEHNTLNPKQKAALAKQLNLRPRQVEVWFQNRRARTKLKQTEVECLYLKRCCEELSEENRRLQKDLADLRALKTAPPFPFYMRATTLSMCPSCERIASNPSSAASTSAPTLSLSTTPPPSTTTTTNSAAAAAVVAAPVRVEHRPSSFAALFAATRSFPLASHQPRPPAPASNCL